MPSLTEPKLELFARFVAEGQSHKEAAISAGYSNKSASAIGSRLAKKVNVSQRISELHEAAATLSVQRSVLNKDWIIEKLKENVERALQVIAVLDNEGKQTGEYRYEGNVANRALELLGKHLGLFEPQPDKDDSAPKPRIIIGLPDGGEADAKPLNADALRSAGKCLPVQ